MPLGRKVYAEGIVSKVYEGRVLRNHDKASSLELLSIASTPAVAVLGCHHALQHP